MSSPNQPAQVVNNTQININTDDTPASVPDRIIKAWDQLGLTLTSNGAPIANLDNAIKIFERGLPKDLIWFDDFHGKYFSDFDFNTLTKGKRREWNDIDDLNLAAFFQRSMGLTRIGDDMVHKAAILHASRNPRNEPLQFISSLRWDNVDRCEMFFSECMGADDNHYTRSASLNFWLSLVARILKPGCQVDSMVVFEGKQGTGKTSALRAIGGSWHTEIKESVTEKDFFLSLQGKLLVEISELDSFKKAEITRIKQVISCPSDRFRAPYASVPKDHPRQCIFAATTNESIYLRDDTGARRFWPIKCGTIALDKITRLRDQLFAESFTKMMCEGTTWWEMPEDLTRAEQERRRQADPWEDSISYYAIGKESLTVEDIIKDALEIKVKDVDRRTQIRIAAILRLLGFERHQQRKDGRNTRIWKRTIPEQLEGEI